ncbi:MAG: GH3 auxin-responsive promoter family protein [Pyrinomonadaceae bacterium]|nr:GH3 auxin-responsive promoter family protein [Phycisphaerales bacterium]
MQKTQPKGSTSSAKLSSTPRSTSKRRWTALVGVGLNARVAARIHQLSNLDLWKRRTASIQIAQLRKLLLTAADTEFGKAHDFRRLAMLPPWDVVAAYQRAVPQGDFAAYRADIVRMREHGQANILWPGVVKDYAQTSGTTAGDKYIPVSKQMLRSNFLASLDIFANAARFGASLPAITNGRCLFLGGSTSLSTNDHGIRTGDLSGLVTPLIKWPITKIYSPGPKIALMSHWPSKIDAMAEACIDQDIRMISGMPSWALVLFEKVIELARKRGRKAECVRDVWPNLMLFVHGGVKYTPFDPRVRQMFSGRPDGDDIPYRLELYPASEGFIAMQDTQDDPGMRLLSDIGNFYEFIPLEEIDSPTARAFTCDQVEKGQRYVVTMSTCAGFWRYIIGDVVEFDNIPSRLDGRGGDGPCRLRIVGRHRHFINAFGENLIVEHIENAVAAAAKATGTVIGEFTAAPVYAGPGRRAGLELAVEVAGDPKGVRIEPFRDAFDKSLKDQNVDYTTKRTDDVGMVPPTITPIAVGSFHRWLESKGKLGGQHKCPRCANHREIIDGLIEVAGQRR